MWFKNTGVTFSVLSQSTRVTDGRTDGQTESFLVDRPRCMHACMQRGENWNDMATVINCETRAVNTDV